MPIKPVATTMLDPAACSKAFQDYIKALGALVSTLGNAELPVSLGGVASHDMHPLQGFMRWATECEAVMAPFFGHERQKYQMLSGMAGLAGSVLDELQESCSNLGFGKDWQTARDKMTEIGQTAARYASSGRGAAVRS